jgi:hypothetical protein
MITVSRILVAILRQPWKLPNLRVGAAEPTKTGVSLYARIRAFFGLITEEERAVRDAERTRRQLVTEREAIHAKTEPAPKPVQEGDVPAKIPKPKPSRGTSFILEVAAEVHLRMGGRPTTDAQRRKAKQLAARLMLEKGHRHIHTERDLPMVLLALMSPTKFEASVDLWLKTTLADNPKFSGPLSIEWKEVA